MSVKTEKAFEHDGRYLDDSWAYCLVSVRESFPVKHVRQTWMIGARKIEGHYEKKHSGCVGQLAEISLHQIFISEKGVVPVSSEEHGWLTPCSFRFPFTVI